MDLNDEDLDANHFHVALDVDSAVDHDAYLVVYMYIKMRIVMWITMYIMWYIYQDVNFNANQYAYHVVYLSRCGF